MTWDLLVHVFSARPVRFLLRACLLLVLLLITAVFTLPYTLPWLLQKQGIDLHWQNPQWHYNGFSAAQININLDHSATETQQLQLDNFSITFAWHSFPIRHLTASRLQAHWPITSNATNDDDTELALPKSILKWLPQHIDLPSIDANLAGLGVLQGSLNLQASAQGKLWQPSFIDTQLTLSNLQGNWLRSIPLELKPTQLSAQITTHPDHQDTPDGQQLLHFNLYSTGPARLQLNGLLDLQQTPEWQGSLSNAQLFIELAALQHPALSAQDLQARLYFSGHTDTQNFSLKLHEHSSLEAQNLEIIDSINAEKVALQLAGLHIQGANAAVAELEVSSPIHMHIAKLSAAQLHSQDWDLHGTLSGPLAQLDLNSSLVGQHGLKLHNHIFLRDGSVTGSLSLDNISFTAGNPLQQTFTDWPQAASIQSGLLRSTVDFNFPPQAAYQLAINLHASELSAKFDNNTLDNLSLDLSAQLAAQQSPNWPTTLTAAQLNIHAATVTTPDLRAEKLQAQTSFSGSGNTESLTLHFAPHSNVQAQKIQLPNIASATKATLQLTGLKLQSDRKNDYAPKIHSPLTAHITNLNAEQLHSQNWDFTGTLNGQLPLLELSGDLKSQHGLTLSSHIRLLKNAVQGNATLHEVYFKAGNPLQKTFSDWPELVTFDSGRLRSEIAFTLPDSAALKVTAKGSASGLNGIINRSELKNLGFDFNAQLNGSTLTLSVPHLTITELDPGVPVSAIELKQAHYRTALDAPLQGTAEWKSIAAQVFNGRVWLDAQQLDLSRKQKLLLQLRGLELQELFRIYPTEGLAGSGIIDGQLPLFIEHDSIYIEAGQLQAREPGVLQFQSEKIEALGRSNPAMRIVADALDDFHFNLLSSGVSYDQSGKLLLNLHLEGQNPDVKKGRPINLNINLEEDIPALLASIQLSGQVSEIIQKRVRERLENR